MTFRRLAQRIRDTRAPAVNVLAPFLLSLVTLHGVVSSQDRPRPDSSSQAVTLQAEAQDPQVVIQRVLEHRDFGGERVVSRWEFVGNSPSFSGGMIPGIGGVAEVLWILMWAFAILVVLWALYKVVQSFGWGAGKGRGRASGGPPAEVMGMDVRPESLPDDISVEAWRLWMAGDAVGCLGLLYRGSLAILIHEMHVDIRRSFTESDCLRAVGDTCAVPMSQYFGGLTSAWQSCAYGHRVPVESAARLLCDSWPDHFRGDA